MYLTTASFCTQNTCQLRLELARLRRFTIVVIPPFCKNLFGWALAHLLLFTWLRRCFVLNRNRKAMGLASHIRSWTSTNLSLSPKRFSCILNHTKAQIRSALRLRLEVLGCKHHAPPSRPKTSSPKLLRLEPPAGPSPPAQERLQEQCSWAFSLGSAVFRTVAR